MANKYLRQIHAAEGPAFVTTDIYAVLAAWGVTCPAIQHAVKKLLMPGQRGGKDAVQDLMEARDSITRAIQLRLADSGRAEVTEEYHRNIDAMIARDKAEANHAD